MFAAYVLRSLRDGTHYYGSCSNLEQRLREHNNGKVRYTKGHAPYVVHYVEWYETRSEAFRRERFFKSIAGYLWLKDHAII
jgi:putative endonuclease